MKSYYKCIIITKVSFVKIIESYLMYEMCCEMHAELKGE